MDKQFAQGVQSVFQIEILYMFYLQTSETGARESRKRKYRRLTFDILEGPVTGFKSRTLSWV